MNKKIIVHREHLANILLAYSKYMYKVLTGKSYKIKKIIFINKNGDVLLLRSSDLVLMDKNGNLIGYDKSEITTKNFKKATWIPALCDLDEDEIFSEDRRSERVETWYETMHFGVN